MNAVEKQDREASAPELARLKRNLKTLSGEVAKVQKPVDRTHVAVHGAKAMLGMPRKLSRSMKWVASKSDTLRDSALFLMPFPIIGTLAGRLAKVLRSVKSKAERAKRAADKLERRTKPARDAVARIAPPVSKAKASLDRAQALLHGWFAAVEAVESNLQALEQSAQEVARVCAEIDDGLAPELENISTRRASLTDSLDTLSAGFEGIVKAGKPLGDAVDAADDIVRKLRPLEKPLNALRKALRPVQWALDAASWLTSRVIDPVVDEVLKKVGLERLVRDLEAKLNPLARLVAPLERAADSIDQFVDKVRRNAAVARSLNEIPAMERRIVTAMRPLKRLSG